MLGPDDAGLIRASGDEVFDSAPKRQRTAEFLSDPRHHIVGALFEHGRSLGCGEAWVLTETDNTAARGLYSAVGGQEETVAYLTFKI